MSQENLIASDEADDRNVQNERDHEIVNISNTVDENYNNGISWMKASFLIVNAALGAGLLNFPFAFKEAGGIAAGNFLHLIFVIMALGSIMVMGRFASMKNCNTYQEVVKQYCGSKWSLVCSYAITLYCFVTCITFVIIIGDQFDRALYSYVGPYFCHKWYLNRAFTMTFSCIFLVWPCCLKRIDGLQSMSYVGVVSIWYLIAVIVAEWNSDSYDAGAISYWNFSEQTFTVIPTICFGYQCHVSSIPIYSCIKGRKVSSFYLSCLTAILTCLIVYTVGANFGYLTFGALVKGDILLSYDATKPQVLIALILLAIKSWTTYPILLYCVREAVVDIYLHIRMLTREQTESSEPLRRKIIAIILWLATLILAVFTPGINVVVKLLGSLASTFILVFPGLCLYLDFTENMQTKSFRNISDCLSFIAAIFYLTVGIFTFGLAFMLGAYDITSTNSEEPLCAW